MNCVQCLLCGEVLISEFRHDYKQCKCPNQTFVDGGGDYIRSGGITSMFCRIVTEDNPALTNDEIKDHYKCAHLREIIAANYAVFKQAFETLCLSD